MHPIERHYLAFAKHFGAELGRAEQRYRAEACAVGEDLETVYLSRRGALHFLGVRASDANLVAALRSADQLQAWVAYRRHRQLYVVDDALAELLTVASWPEALDVSSLFLPVPGAGISFRLSGAREQAHFVGFYDLVPVQDGHERELRFVQVQQDGAVTPCGSVRLSGGSLEVSLQREAREIMQYIEGRKRSVGLDAVGAHLARGAEHLDEAMHSRGLLLRQILNVLLYIHGNEDVVARVHPGKRAGVSHQGRPRSIRRAAERASLSVFDVGRGFSSTLRHWEEAEERTRLMGAANSDRHIRPHVRRAHLHLYWTGPGRAVPKFQLVKPTLVRGGSNGEAASVRNVR